MESDSRSRELERASVGTKVAFISCLKAECFDCRNWHAKHLMDAAFYALSFFAQKRRKEGVGVRGLGEREHERGGRLGRSDWSKCKRVS